MRALPLLPLLTGCHPAAFEFDFELVSVAESYAVDPSGPETNEPTWDHDASFGINQTVWVPCEGTEGLVADDIDAVDPVRWRVAGPYSGKQYAPQANTTIAAGATLLQDVSFSLVVGECGAGTPIAEGVVPAGTAVLDMPQGLLDEDAWSSSFRPADAAIRLSWAPFDDGNSDGAFADLVRGSLSHNGAVSRTALDFDVSVCTDPVEVQVPASSDVTWGNVTWVHMAEFQLQGAGTPCTVSEEGS